LLLTSHLDRCDAPKAATDLGAHLPDREGQESEVARVDLQGDVVERDVRGRPIRVIETEGRPQRVVITSEGMAAIGIEREDDGQTTAPAEADTAPTPVDTASAVEIPAPAAEPDAAAKPAKRRAKAKAKAAEAPAEKPTPRAGTKQAQMIEMLKRPEGATVEQIAEATGWQHHTIRGAISGALKKKLGLTVEATRTREIGPNRVGAKGSSTVYRITGSGPETGSPSAAG
jgi:hypothetical protein